MKRSLPRPLIALACFALAPSSVRAASPLDALLDLVPPQAVAVIAAPNLRAASDDFATSIEAMDRGHLLLGGKPLDHLKAMLGFSVGVNDLGGAAVALMPLADGDESPQDQNLIAIVAVTDADTFVNGNFESVFYSGARAGPATCLHPEWGTLYVKSMVTHVALSPRRALLDRIGAANREESFALKRLGAQGVAAARRGDVFLFLDRSACGVHELVPQLRRVIEMMPAAPAMESLLISIDFDPLGWFVRGRAVFPQESEEGRLATAMNEARSARGSTGAELRVPDRAFILAGGVNASLITDEVAAAWTGKTWVRRILDLFAPAQAAEFAAYPVDGYLLNGAFAVFRAGDGARLGGSLRALIDAQSSEQRSVLWRDDRFELRGLRRAGGVDFTSALFGAAGPRGVIGHETTAAFVTLSERRATVEQARQAASGGGHALADNPIVESMRTWMPRHRDVEAYLDPAALFARFDHPSIPVRLPKFEPGQPPIGFAVGFEPAAANFTLIAPAGVLTPIVDSQIERAMGRALGAERSPALHQ